MIVLLLLKIEVSDEMRADIITANISPLSPVGMILSTSFGKAIFVQPFSLSHTSIHDLGSAQATSSEIKKKKKELVCTLLLNNQA
jgi:hypothetical protein